MSKRSVVRSYPGTWLALVRFSDLAAIGVCGVTSYGILYPQQPIHTVDRFSIVIALVSFALIAIQFRLYRPWRGRRLRNELAIIGAALACTALVLLAVYKLQVEVPSAAGLDHWISIWFGSTFFAQWFARIFFTALSFWWYSHHSRGHNVALVGFGAVGAAAIIAISRYPQYGLTFVGYFDDREVPRNGFLTESSRLGSTQNMDKIIEADQIDQIWIAYPFRAEQRIAKILEELKYSTVNVRYLLDTFAFKLVEKPLTDIIGIPMMDLEVSPMEGINRYVKEVEDRLAALILLTLFSPLMLVLAVGVTISSPGPILYRQERMTWNNRRFMMFKFRSMPVDVEATTGPMWAKPGEQRATALGAFLRKTSLDELPQLLNVLRGDMSIVGPRPERSCFVEKFKDQIPDYMKKHMVKAGMTGWAQVNGWRGDTDISRRIECDIYYIQNWSLLFDLKIAVMTIFRGFISKNSY
jgi:putative colanic acid biosynthesis UDP-glucose lipid carrier transferase